MPIKPLVTVGDFAFPDPAPGGYEANTATIVDSARNLQGYVTGAVIRDDVAKISLSWNALTPQQWANILACFDPTRGGSFYNDVTFLNQSTNQYETRRMYVSDRSAGLYMRDSENGDAIIWTKPKLSLIEV